MKINKHTAAAVLRVIYADVNTSYFSGKNEA